MPYAAKAGYDVDCPSLICNAGATQVYVAATEYSVNPTATKLLASDLVFTAAKETGHSYCGVGNRVSCHLVRFPPVGVT